VDSIGENQNTAEFSGVMGDGSEFRIRDRADLSEPGMARISAFTWDGEDWQLGHSATWTRIAPVDGCPPQA